MTTNLRKNKGEKYLKSSFEFCLTNVKEHYLVSEITKRKILTADPFRKAVDPIKYPDYALIVTDPMDINRMEKKLSSGKYGFYDQEVDLCQCILLFLADMDLIHHNCYTYNTGEASADIRAMVDALRNYFRYLLRICLRLLQSCGEVALVTLLLHPAADQSAPHPSIQSFLLEHDQEDVEKFLILSNRSMEDLVQKTDLVKLLGMKPTSTETKQRVQAATTLNLVNANKRSQNSSSRVSSAGSAKTVSLPKSTKKAGNRPSEAVPVKSEPVPVPAPAPIVVVEQKESSAVIAKTASAPRSKKRKLSQTGSAAIPASESVDSHGGGSAGVLDDDAFEALFADDEIPPPPPPPSSSSLVVEPAAKKSKKSTTGTTPTAKTKAAQPAAPPPAFDPFEGDDEDLFGDGEAAPVEGVVVKERADWQIAADNVLKALGKHPYVDISRPATAVADFYIPVIEANPSIRDEYLSVIKKPMDLNTLRHELDQDLLSGSLDFYNKAVSVFQNAVDYNYLHSDSPYAVRLAERSQILVVYAKWLCLEMLPLDDDSKTSSPLRPSIRDQCRREREEIISSFSIAAMEHNPYSECKKLLKDMERCRTSSERRVLPFFLEPVNEKDVTDYIVYVRHPADISSIKYRLDGTLPVDSRIANAINKHAPRYQTYGEFLTDMRRVFSNAITYNQVHLESDTTGMSKIIYEAAQMYSERLEGLLPKLTMGFADRVQRAKLDAKELAEQLESIRKRKLEQEQEMEEITKKIIDEVKQTDSVYAAEFDFEKKQRETELQLQQQLLAQRKALVLAANQQGQLLEDLVHDVPPEEQMSAVNNQSPSGAANAPLIEQESRSLLITGFGVGGQVPSRYNRMQILAKLELRKKVWSAWTDDLCHVPTVSGP